MIVKLKRGYVVKSHDGSKILSRPYAHREDAERRLHQIEVMKHLPRRRKARKNPLGPGFGAGLIAGVAAIGAVWGLLYYFNGKTAAAATGGGCNLCLEALPGQTVPSGATGAVTGSYKGFTYSTYFIDSDTTLAWGWGVDGSGHHLSNWGFATQALADADARKVMDSL